MLWGVSPVKPIPSGSSPQAPPLGESHPCCQRERRRGDPASGPSDGPQRQGTPGEEVAGGHQGPCPSELESKGKPTQPAAPTGSR